MDGFRSFVSNCVAGSANQFVFDLPKDQVRRGRIFYRIQAAGEYPYSLLFSNVLDSTYGDGSLTRCNQFPAPWRIHEAKVFRCRSFPQGQWKQTGLPPVALENETPLLFQGEREKVVAPGEFFSSDPCLLSFEKGEFLCLELAFSGTRLPYHEETLLPVFLYNGKDWLYDRRMPVPGRIGCRREVKKRVAFLGDSITQGIGTPRHSYLHWNALVADALGDSYAFWNLGIGFARASDAASDGAWLYKAKQCDAVILCLGTNDILVGRSARELKGDLTRIVALLKESGPAVLVQTVPPFDYNEAEREVFFEVNDFIRRELAASGVLVFDVAPLLALSPEEPHRARFGGHPDPEGCKLWAEALLDFLATTEFL